MKGVYVIDVKYEEVRKVLMDEMKKCSSSDVPLYVRKLEFLRALRGAGDIVVRVDDLLETRNNEVRNAIVKQVVDRVVSLKSKLEEIKEKAVSEGGVYLSEAEIVSDTLDCYERIAERNEFYIRIV